MAFFLFLLVNAALFLRPGEIVPDWKGLEIYFVLITLCLVCSFSELMRYLSPSSLAAQPITWCLFGILALVPLAPLVSLNFAEAGFGMTLFVKVLLYYLLGVSLVNTPARLRILLGWLVVCCTGLTILTVLKYHGVIELTTFNAVLLDHTDMPTGEVIYYQRLQGSGIFQDPNDLCMVLAAFVPITLYFLVAERNVLVRLFSAGALVLFLYAIYLTHSRGGLLALMGGLGVWCWTRYGWQRAVFLAAVGLPVLLFVFGGRQTSISTDEGTGQSRIQLWSDWMQEFRASPILGGGLTPTAEEARHMALTGETLCHAAHNSYLQAFADIGFAGGCLFLGQFGLALWSVLRPGRKGHPLVDPQQRRLQPYLVATLAAYAVGMLSLSQCWTAPTYMMLSLAGAFTRTTATWPPQPSLRLDTKMLGRFAGAGVCYLALMYVFIRLFVNRI